MSGLVLITFFFCNDKRSLDQLCIGREGGGGANQSSKVQNARGVAGGRLKLLIDGRIIDKNE